MTVEKEKSELNLVILGPPQKRVLFQKLCAAADKYEQHVHYNDVHYLTVNLDGKPITLEVTDPGMAHTGNREMAIRRCDFAILYYSVMNAPAFQQLSGLASAFQLRKNLPLHLICDTDEVIEYEDSTSGLSSLSEGYESDVDTAVHIVRRQSMQRLRDSLEESFVPDEQGQQLAVSLGPQCRVTKISGSQFNEERRLLEEIVSEIMTKKHSRTGISITRRLRKSTAKSEKVPKQDKKNKKEREQDSGNGTWAEESTNSSRRNSEKNSKVCSIM